MPCNPNIGGTAKDILYASDALGGEMGKIADKVLINQECLTKQGPAVFSLRAQIDRSEYQKEMKHRRKTALAGYQAI